MMARALEKSFKKASQQCASLFGYNLVSNKEYIPKRDGYHYVPNIYGKGQHKLLDIRQHEPFNTLASQVIQAKRTSLYYDRLYIIYQAVAGVQDRLASKSGVPSPIQFAEVGVYKGGTSYMIAHYLSQQANPVGKLYSVDTFEGHAAADLPQAEVDHLPGNFNDTSFEGVSAYLAPFPNAQVIQGRIQDVAPQLAEQTFGFAHLDMDIYHPTVFALDFFYQRLLPGGVIVVDDYGFTTCPGARQAVDEFMALPVRMTGFELQTGQYLMVKY